MPPRSRSRSRRARAATVLAALLVATTLLAGAVPAAATDGAPSADEPPTATPSTAQVATQECAATSPPDHADPDGDTGDVIGWVDGYWYDERIDVDASDGLDEGERERLTARTAARVETLRCLAFDELPPVEVQTREEYGEQIREELANESERAGPLLNASASTMFLMRADEDWADVQASVLTAGVGAYYDPETEQITMLVGETGDVPRERILAHELVHALQDQQFDLDRFDARAQSRYDAQRGVIEGEATLVQEAYGERCDDGRWSEPCVSPGPQPQPDLPDAMGAVVLFQQPYMFGPAFVEDQRTDGGWTAVSDLYDAMPEHSVHVVAPETYGTVDVTLPEVPDRSSDEWERVTADERPDHEVVGQAALTTMFVAPDLDPRVDGWVVPSERLFDLSTNRASNFDLEETSGWRGDRMVAYTDGDRLATVWELSWANATAAERFHDTYLDLLEVYGGSSVEGSDGVYTFDEESRFDRAVAVALENDSVRIVTAPTVDDLSAVHDVDRPATDESDDDGLPGPGVVGALAALLAVALVAAHRR